MASHPSCRRDAPAPCPAGISGSSSDWRSDRSLPASRSTALPMAHPGSGERRNWRQRLRAMLPPSGLGLAMALPGCLLLQGVVPALARAEGQVQLNCPGTLLEARGQAELQRQTARLQVSIGLEAQGATADQALGQLQSRLGAVRASLQALGVTGLQVSSPSSWQRPAEAGRAAVVQASLQLSGQLAPERLQSLIRTVGSLPGVQLAPVTTLADPAEDARVRLLLLQRAWQDALRQAKPLAELIERPKLTPLEVRIDGQELSPVALRAMAADAGNFRPEELTKPKDRLGLQVRFCAQ